MAYPANNLADMRPDLAEQLVCVYNKDGSVSDKKAEEVTVGSNLKAGWNCDKSELGHSSYVAVVKDRTKANGTNCPTCSGKRVEAGINDLGTTHPELASLAICVYEKDGSVSARKVSEVSAGSHLKAEWVCEFGHSSYKAQIRNRANGRGCPTCSGKRTEKGVNDLATHHKIVASELLFVYAKDGNISNLTADEVSAGSAFKAEWRCSRKELNHPSYSARICDRTKWNATGCSLCATGKTETAFRDSFSRHAKNNFLSARMPLERELFTSGMIQIDMLCEDLKLVVEYDGARAHGGVNNADKKVTLEDCLARDTDSTLALVKAGYKVIRIREWDKVEQLAFLELPEEYASDLHQVAYKSFGKDKDDIDFLVKQIIEERDDWFVPSASNNATSVDDVSCFAEPAVAF